MLKYDSILVANCDVSVYALYVYTCTEYSYVVCVQCLQRFFSVHIYIATSSSLKGLGLSLLLDSIGPGVLLHATSQGDIASVQEILEKHPHQVLIRTSLTSEASPPSRIMHTMFLSMCILYPSIIRPSSDAIL